MIPYQFLRTLAGVAGWWRTAAMATLVAVLFMVPMAAPVAATAPDNDNLANANAISTLPFDAYPDMSQATLESGEAIGCDNGYGLDQSVWYTWTSPAAGQLTVQVDGSWGGVTAAVYGPMTSLPGDVTTVGAASACVFYPGPDNALRQSVGMGETYLFQVTTISSWSVSPHLGISEALPPANDNKADATVINALPFGGDVDLTLATLETGETTCGFGLDRTAWYRYTPTADGTLEIGLSRDQGLVSGLLYAGSDLAITSAGAPGCFSNGGLPTRFVVKADTPYYLQVADSSESFGSEPVHIAVNPGPPPLAVSVVVGPNATVTRAGGVATLSFTVTCSDAADFWIYATLRERLTRTVVASAFSDGGGQCGPSPTVLRIGFADPNHPFVVGSAQVSYHLAASDGWSSVQSDQSATMKLRYAK